MLLYLCSKIASVCFLLFSFFLVEALQLRITFYVWYTFLKTSDNSGLIFPWTKYWNATFWVKINLGTLILRLPCCQPFSTLFHYPCPVDTLSYQLCYPGQVTWPVCASVCTSAKVMIRHTRSVAGMIKWDHVSYRITFGFLFDMTQNSDDSSKIEVYFSFR